MSFDRRSFTFGAASLGLAAATPLGALAAKSKKPAPPAMLDVLILGAGVSGLQAAWMLEQEGLKVTVLEGRNRVGGRIVTLLDQPGYPEMGFNSMAEGYGRGIDAARRAGVELVDVGAWYRSGKPTMLWFDGKPMTREEWAAHPGNPFPDALKTTLPAEIVGKFVAGHTRLKDWLAWADPANAALDTSLYDFLKSQGLSDAAIRLGNDWSPAYGTSAWDISRLMLEFNDGFVKAQFAAGSKSLAVKDGNIHLPNGMAKLIKGDVLLGREVVAIETSATKGVVHCRDGSRFEAKRVVCSLPFSTLRHIHILPALTGVQAEAVSSIPYQPLSMAFLTVTSPFWEEDGFAPGMWTNSIVGTVIPQKFGKTPEEITGLTLQARGQLAQYWDRMGKDALLASVTSELEKMRPAAKGKLRGAAYFSWSNEAFNAGDWAYFTPGQVSRYVGEMAKPAGRLHFCGEHTGTAARGLESALESAERVVLEVLGG